MIKALIAAVAACCAALLVIAGQAPAWAGTVDGVNVPTAYAQFYYGPPGPYAYGYYGRPYYGRPYYGGAAAAGVAGLAAGALVGGAIASQGARPPEDPNWVASCARRYRTFDAASGTYLASDGQRYVCQ